MKIALAQINPTIGDFEGNCGRIVAAAEAATQQGAELTVFSEMCLLGYPARDLLERPSFLDAQDRALERLHGALYGMPVVLGLVRRRSGDGNALFNSCALLEDGQLAAVADKCLLPTYDVFDEDRYFEEARSPAPAAFRGVQLGLTVCEDCWNDKDFWRQRKYAFDPVEILVRAGAQVFINISASPFSMGKQLIKELMLSALAKKHCRPLVYVNQVGGNDDLLFDGRSLAFDAHGKLIARGPAFEEGITVVEIEVPAPKEADRPASRITKRSRRLRLGNEEARISGPRPAIPEQKLADAGLEHALQFPDGKHAPLVSKELSAEEEVHRALVLGTRDYARKCGFKTAVLGLSGGIDSAVVGALAAEAFGPQNVTGVALPSRYNAPESLADARDLAQRLGIRFHVVGIEELAQAFKHALAPLFAGCKEDVTEENVQARLRGVLLMALSNKFGSLLLTTGNKSEVATGYCTLYGDMCGGLAVISDLYKTMVYRLARHLNDMQRDRPPIPESSLTKAPSAELRFNQTDQDSLPPYDTLDGILKAHIEELRPLEELVALGYERATVQQVLRLVDLSEYKRRQAAPGLRVTSKAFGTGRRMPIAQRFREWGGQDGH
ncbi:MAG: NAD+ synthase [Planctomycetota bacterium]